MKHMLCDARECTGLIPKDGQHYGHTVHPNMWFLVEYIYQLRNLVLVASVGLVGGW